MFNIVILNTTNKQIRLVKTKLIRPSTLRKKDSKVNIFQKKRERSTKKKNYEKTN